MAVRRTWCVVLLIGLLFGAVTVPPAVAQSDRELGALQQRVLQLEKAGRHAEALPLAERLAELVRRRFGDNRQEAGSVLFELGERYEHLARLPEAEAAYQRSLAIYEKVLPAGHTEIAAVLTGLASVYSDQNRLADAVQLLQRALAIYEKALPPDHPHIAVTLNNLAVNNTRLGRLTEAEMYYKRALAIRERLSQANHPDTAKLVSNLALLQLDQGRFVEAEASYRRAITILEKAGPAHTVDLANTLSKFAQLYMYRHLWGDAEPLLNRALTLKRSVLPEFHDSIAVTLHDLAMVNAELGRSEEAASHYKRAYEILQKVLPEGHPRIAITLANMAGLMDLAEALPYRQRVLDMMTKALPEGHPDIATSLHNLGWVHLRLGNLAQAEDLYKRTLASRSSSLPPNHPEQAASLQELTIIYFQQQRWREALEYARRGTSMLIERSRTASVQAGTGAQATGREEVARGRSHYLLHLRVAHNAAKTDPGGAAQLSDEAFRIGQWVGKSEAAAALSQMAVRFSASGSALAGLVRERQDLVDQWHNADKTLLNALAIPVERRGGADESARRRIAAINARIAEIDRTLASDFPDYAALANPQPLSVDDVRALLRADEALVLFVDAPEHKQTKLPQETFIWVVTSTEARWVRTGLGTKALREQVASLRCGLDHALWKGGEAQDRCVEMLNNKYSYQLSVDGVAVDVLPFDLERAHALYKALLGPVEDLIKDKHLLVVPSGPLTSLPFNVLVTEPPKARMVASLAEHRQVAWLGTRQPITVLPSVASLKSLRQFAKTSRASKLYLGIGNPLLDGPQDHPQWGEYFKQQAAAAKINQSCTGRPTPIQIASARGRRAVTSFTRVSRRGQADIEEVRRCTPLPDTADELCEVARRLGVPESEVLLGTSATETRLKQLSEQGQLANYAILHFATHGALTGQVEGAAEPGLILTPPAKGTQDVKALERDDGFLTASEIATLKLDADWVILSACNTAGAQGENAEALSGMARAFFYAGARALVVSHWEVGSGAAVKLATGAFAELNANPRLGRAEAFRLSMRELIEKGTAYDAHPSQWAPFVVVGEGR
jgi:CHAT domain-containing protein/tetratricopeptide (TPR) repeat protein